jgi:histidine ammonia-lyase
MLGDDRHLHPDIEAAIRLVRSGALAEAAGPELLPTLAGDGP